MSKPKSSWVDITDILTDKGVEALKAGKDIGFTVGQVLVFDYEGSKTNFRITRMDRNKGRMWGKEIQLYHPDDVEVVDK